MFWVGWLGLTSERGAQDVILTGYRFGWREPGENQNVLKSNPRINNVRLLSSANEILSHQPQLCLAYRKLIQLTVPLDRTLICKSTFSTLAAEILLRTCKWTPASFLIPIDDFDLSCRKTSQNLRLEHVRTYLFYFSFSLFALISSFIEICSQCLLHE